MSLELIIVSSTKHEGIIEERDIEHKPLKIAPYPTIQSSTKLKPPGDEEIEGNLAPRTEMQKDGSGKTAAT